MPSAAYRRTRGPNKVGRPKAHWAESCLVEAVQRIIDHLRSDASPSHSLIDHEIFPIPSALEIRETHSSGSIVWMNNTLLYRKVSIVARNSLLVVGCKKT